MVWTGTKLRLTLINNCRSEITVKFCLKLISPLYCHLAYSQRRLQTKGKEERDWRCRKTRYFIREAKIVLEPSHLCSGVSYVILQIKG